MSADVFSGLLQVFVSIILIPPFMIREYLMNIRLTPPPQTDCDTRSIFRRNEACLLSFSQTGCLIKAKKKSVCPTIYIIPERID